MVNQTMSAQWELVGKSNKKVVVPTKKLSKTEKKKFVENAPKIEDILPLDQIRTLYNALDGKKEAKKPQPSIAKEAEKKPKKKAPVVSEKRDQAAKEKPIPKTLEAAAKQLDLKELISVVEVNQARFPDVPVLWAKGVAEYLNARLAHSGSAHSGSSHSRPQDAFLSVLPAGCRDVLYKAVAGAGQTHARHFYEHCLSAMVADMSKGNASVAGYKVILQLSAAQSASAVLENPSKVHALWTSFQSQQPIGLAILWSLGQLGIKDISVGLTVWQELMLPMLEMRNYTAFVVGYLKMLSAMIPRGKPVATDQLMAVIDIAFSSSATSIPINLRKEMAEAAAAMLKKTLECKPESRLRLLFQPLVDRLNPSAIKLLEKELVTSLALCLKLDAKCFSIWQKIYRKDTDASVRLLQYLRNGHWRDLNAKLLRETLLSFQTANQELVQNKQLRESVRQCQAICEEILPKLLQMTVVRQSFPWRFGSFLLLLAIAAVLAIDVKRHGSFRASSTGVFLQEVGVLDYGRKAWTQTKLYSSKGAAWAADNLPVYYKTASDASGPYLRRAKEATFVAGSYLNQTYWNLAEYAQEKAPLVEAWCDQYAPGLVHKVQVQVTGAWGLVKDCAFWLGEVIVRQSHLIIDWAKTNVFVGGLSPEKLQQFSKEALNTTQEYAFWTYKWVVEKYHTLASIQ